MTRPRKKSQHKRDSNPGSSALKADASTTRLRGTRGVRTYFYTTTTTRNAKVAVLGRSLYICWQSHNHIYELTGNKLLSIVPLPDQLTWFVCSYLPYIVDYYLPNIDKLTWFISSYLPYIEDYYLPNIDKLTWFICSYLPYIVDYYLPNVTDYRLYSGLLSP